MTSGVIRDAGAPEKADVVSAGRPPWWLLAVALVVGSLVTIDLLTRGWLERMDLQVSEVISDWQLQDSAAFPFIWVVTQVGGRVTILVVLAVLVGYLAWSRHTWLPLVRVLTALALLTLVVYGIKNGTGRTAPDSPGPSSSTRTARPSPRGMSRTPCSCGGSPAGRPSSTACRCACSAPFWCWPSPARSPRAWRWCRWTIHWVTDAVVGACVGLLLLGVVHALDAVVLSRWVRARAGRQTA